LKRGQSNGRITNADGQDAKICTFKLGESQPPSSWFALPRCVDVHSAIMDDELISARGQSQRRGLQQGAKADGTAEAEGGSAREDTEPPAETARSAVRPAAGDAWSLAAASSSAGVGASTAFAPEVRGWKELPIRTGPSPEALAVRAALVRAGVADVDDALASCLHLPRDAATAYKAQLPVEPQAIIDAQRTSGELCSENMAALVDYHVSFVGDDERLFFGRCDIGSLADAKREELRCNKEGSVFNDFAMLSGFPAGALARSFAAMATTTYAPPELTARVVTALQAAMSEDPDRYELVVFTASELDAALHHASRDGGPGREDGSA